MVGILRVRVLKGVNLAIRDFNSSDPYVIFKMGAQRLKTRVIKNNINPDWNELLTLTVEDPTSQVRIDVYNKNALIFDDHMGFAVFDIAPFAEAGSRKLGRLQGCTTIKKIIPSRKNCLAEQSIIHGCNGKIVQNMVLRLRGVEQGEIELQLEWAYLPGSGDSQV